MRLVTIAFAAVLVLSVLAGAYIFSVGQLPNNSINPSPGNNVVTSVVVNQSALTTEQPPLPKNGSIPQATVACYNYSVPFTPLYTFNIVTSSASPTVQGVTIKVLCNGCGISSDNSSYRSIPQNTPAEWKGTYSDGNRTVSVNGICDESFGFDRNSPSAWNVQWSFQRLSVSGTLEVVVSSDNNQTVIFDKSVSASSSTNTVSGSLSIPSGS